MSQLELLEQPDHGFIAPAWFWAELKKLNALADNPTDANFILITKRINGGTNGLAERQAYWETAKRVLRDYRNELRRMRRGHPQTNQAGRLGRGGLRQRGSADS